MALPNGPLLFVCPFCLDQVGHGNIQRVLAIGRYFAARGVAVDIAYQGRERFVKVDAQYSAYRRVFAARSRASSSEEDDAARRLAAFYGTYGTPRGSMCPSASLTTLVRHLIDSEPYTAVIATYAFTAPVFADLPRRPLTVCDVQDVIHEHDDGCQQVTGQPSNFGMPASTEAFLWRQWDVLVAITPRDEARIRLDLLPHQHIISARHAAPSTDASAPGIDDVAFYGGSSNWSNVQSMTWLLKRVWPLVRRARPAARLRVAGLICSVIPEDLLQTPGVEAIGFQQDVSGEIAACGVLVAPYLYGSGLKIKVVEGACAGKAMVTTSAGLTGTGLDGDSVEVHDDPERFADALASLLCDRPRRAMMAERARVLASTLYSADACYTPIASALQEFGAVAEKPSR